MTDARNRDYRGPVRAVVVDMAGTVVDFGSCAPAGAFVELFARHDVAVTDEQARGPMGLEKRDHIAALAVLPDVAARWRELHGRELGDADIDALYAEFAPLQLQCLPRYGELIPGTLELAAALAERSIQVAATTGYNREMMDVVVHHMAEQGFSPAAATCATDVAAGRPAPWMIFRSMEKLGVFPPAAVIKIGDTLPDVVCGRNAGVWTVGVTRTGNMLGLDREQLAALGDADLADRTAAAERAMLDAGAHYTAHGVGDCIDIIDDIARRIAAGDRP